VSTVALPHDGLVIPPDVFRRTGNERGGCVFFAIIGLTLPVLADKGKMNAQLVLHGDGTAEIEHESDLGFIGEHDRFLTIFNHAAIDVGPSNRQLTLAGGRPYSLVRKLHRSSTLERWSRQENFAGEGR